eukprot:GHVH01007577.1.p1 GENE.GHVH01007577.1~~GHVH01007577.1.p1  ORF type:complete len:124 (+),score=17.13 GHVH01007577.1:114-485(+)
MAQFKEFKRATESIEATDSFSPPPPPPPTPSEAPVARSSSINSMQTPPYVPRPNILLQMKHGSTHIGDQSEDLARESVHLRDTLSAQIRESEVEIASLSEQLSSSQRMVKYLHELLLEKNVTR